MAGKVFSDTSDFFAIDCGDEIHVAGKRFRVTGHERERRFGIEDPKFWVKKARDLESGEKKILKLSYFESFDVRIGGAGIRCFRNPDKEAEILDLVRGDGRFMQGCGYRDPKGNSIRVLDIVPGPNLFVHIGSLRMLHADYVADALPLILRRLVRAFEAIAFLHASGRRHGDIRNDHLIIHRNTGDYVWIDFDYDFQATENPFSLDIFGLGNLLLYTIGKGFHTFHTIRNAPAVYGDLIHRLDQSDFSLLDRWRLVNLRKLFPYIPKPLNDILMHFSKGSEVYYEWVGEIIADLNASLAGMPVRRKEAT